MQKLLNEISTGYKKINPNQNMWQEKFVYSASNNLTFVKNGWGQIQFTYNDANQLTSKGSVSYNHDKLGNLIEETLGSLTSKYTYTAGNRVKEVSHPAFGLSTSTKISMKYTYDG